MCAVLYEVGFQLETAHIIPLMAFVGFAAVLKIKWRELPVALRILFSIACCFLLVLSAVVGKSQYDMYTTIMTAYKNGDYQIVEGHVENFHPMPPEGREDESFDIDGVHFSYSYTPITGYHKLRNDGGVITGDGQYLKIGYIYYSDASGNIILYIEQIDDQDCAQ